MHGKGRRERRRRDVIRMKGGRMGRGKKGKVRAGDEGRRRSGWGVGREEGKDEKMGEPQR